ncbi:MAG: hypothetical protein IJW32_00930 [Clostridia bacterium]|nr:hypothetical protein [Clostridia bacterium]
MKNIFIMGAFFNTDQQDIDAYSYITDVFKNSFENINVTQPIDIENYRNNFIKENPNADINTINKAMVDYDLFKIKQADLLFCDVSNKSTGVGIELGVAKENNINIVFCAKQNSKISNMVYGTFPDKNVYFYSSLDDLKEYIKTLKV